MDIWQTILYLGIGLLIGLVGGFFGSRWFFKRELQKNPPINEKMIRAMFLSMGRKPSEAQVKAVINSMNAQTK
jgi:uncharacterized protein YneF (UPF0154 family)